MTDRRHSGKAVAIALGIAALALLVAALYAALGAWLIAFDPAQPAPTRTVEVTR